MDNMAFWATVTVAVIGLLGNLIILHANKRTSNSSAQNTDADTISKLNKTVNDLVQDKAKQQDQIDTLMAARKPRRYRVSVEFMDNNDNDQPLVIERAVAEPLTSKRASINAG